MTDQALKAAVERVTADVERIASFSPNIATVYSEPEKRYINDLTADLRSLLAALSSQSEAATVLRKLVSENETFARAPDSARVWIGGWSTYSGQRDLSLVHVGDIRRTLGDRHDD